MNGEPRYMMFYIYSRPLKLIFIWILHATALYTFMETLLKDNRKWRFLNFLLAVFMFGTIVYLTLLNRESDVAVLQLKPFISFKIAAEQQDEYYREMLMNVLLFVPFGFGLPYVWPKKWKLGKRVGFSVLATVGFSILIEFFQFCFKLGYVETDDVIMNTIGAVVGIVHMPLAYLFRYIAKKND